MWSHTWDCWYLGFLITVMVTFFGNRIVMNSSQISNPFSWILSLFFNLYCCSASYRNYSQKHWHKWLFFSPCHFTIICKGSHIRRGTHICYIQGVVVGNFMTSGSFSLVCKHFPVNIIMILLWLFLNLSPNCPGDGSSVMKQIYNAYNFFFLSQTRKINWWLECCLCVTTSLSCKVYAYLWNHILLMYHF